MDVFGKGTEEGTRPLLPPGLCWLCDNSPQQEEMRVIDTRRNSRPGQTSTMTTERKYVCEPCAREMGAAVGMVAPEVADTLREHAASEAARAEGFYAELVAARASQFRLVPPAEVVDAVREMVREELAKTIKPKSAAVRKVSDA